MRPYRVFLTELQDELQEAIRVSENAEWHHYHESTPAYQHYLRLLTWEKAVSERVEHHDKSRAKRAWARLRRVPPDTT